MNRNSSHNSNRPPARNPNHPKPGDQIKVEPIRKREDRQRIETLLTDQPRNLNLFDFGCNMAFRAIDLTRLKIGQVRGAKVGFKLSVREQKTGKVREVVLNEKVCASLEAWLVVHPWAANDEAPLFPNLHTGEPLTVPTLSKLVKKWCQQAGLKGNFASHSLRKSFGYAQRVEYGVSLAVLAKLFGHSSERQTMAYLGISDAELDACYLHEI